MPDGSESDRTMASYPGIHPDVWPQMGSPVGIDSSLEARVDRLLADLSLEAKVGQIIQAEIRWVKPKG